MKHNGSLSGSFPIFNGVKQGYVLAPTLFSIFFSIMLREAKEDLPDGIYILFRTDGSLFDLRRLLVRTKTIEELFTELLFAPFSPTRRKSYSTSSTASLMQPRTSASPSA